MAENYIPVFEPSGRGLMADLMEVKRSEAISMGWLKGQYIYYMPKLAGYKTVNGKRCYGDKIIVNGNANTSVTTTYAKNLRSFLELLGMDDSDISDINTTYNNDGVAGIDFIWEQQISFSKTDYEFIYKLMSTNFSEVETIVYSHNDMVYDMPNQQAVASYTINSGNGTSLNYPMMLNSEIFCYDINGVDLTPDMSYYELNALSSITAIAGDLYGDLSSLVKDDEYINVVKDEVGDDIIMYNTYTVRSTETWTNLRKTSFVDNSYSRFSTENHTGTLKTDGDDSNTWTYYDYDGKALLPFAANKFWQYGISYGTSGSISGKQSIFYQPEAKTYWFNQTTTYPVYMTVDGLRQSNPNELIYYISNYAKFDIIEAKRKSGFFGIGGFVGDLLGGILNLFVGIVSLVAKIGLHIPVIRLQVQIFTWLFTGDWTNDKDKLLVTYTAQLMLAIAVAIVIATGGSGTQIAISLMTSAYGLYNSLEDYESQIKYSDESARLKALRESEITSDKLAETISLDESVAVNDYMYNGMFNSYDEVNKPYQSPFDSDGLYNPKFGLG